MISKSTLFFVISALTINLVLGAYQHYPICTCRNGCNTHTAAATTRTKTDCNSKCSLVSVNCQNSCSTTATTCKNKCSTTMFNNGYYLQE